jgi:hypothetical protein
MDLLLDVEKYQTVSCSGFPPLRTPFIIAQINKTPGPVIVGKTLALGSRKFDKGL